MEIRFPVVAGSSVLVAIALAVRSHFERMKFAEIRAFELGKRSAKSEEENGRPTLSSYNFSTYVSESNARA